MLFLFMSLPLWAARQQRVACVGNSITYGLTLADREREAYPSRLQQLLGEDYEVGNFGKSGTTLLRRGHRPYVNEEEYQQALHFGADIVVIHLGTNDTDPRNWPYYGDDFVSDYLRLIESFRQVNPRVRIIIALNSPITSAHRRFLSGTRDWFYQIQDAITTVAQVSGVELIDFHSVLHRFPNRIPDAVHPDAEGAAMLAQRVYAAITGDFGGLAVPKLYTDNMVLQRDRPLLITGIANRGEQIRVRWDGKEHRTTASHDGAWSIPLPAMPAGGPHTLLIRSSDRQLKFSNIMMGDVWLCSGQSNMEFELQQAKGAPAAMEQAGNNRIRLFDEKAIWRTNDVAWSTAALDSVNHLHYFAPSAWQVSTPQAAARFSAVAYFFGKMLSDSLDVPVGLICNAVGGSGIEAWIDRTTLENEFPQLLSDWLHNDFIQDWVRSRAARNISLSTLPLQRHPYEPAYLYEASVHEMRHFPIKGVLWYQGESNAHNCETYARLFPLLVESWRKTWQNDTLPFCFVQLSSIERPSWPRFRDMQRQLALQLPHVWMAVSSDKGDPADVHPTDKQPIGERLARLALYHAYGHHLTPSGPAVTAAHARRNTMRLTIHNGQGMKSSDGQPIRGFEVAQYGGLYEPAEATVRGEEIILKSRNIPHPRLVRYAWQPFTTANLVNGDGLPMSTFRMKVREE